MRPLSHALRHRGKGRPRPDHLPPRRPRDHASEHRQPQRRDPRRLRGSIVATTDGRVLSGVVVEQDKNVVVLRGSDGKERTLARDEIDAMKASPKSLMPEGLLKALSDQQVRDLFAYLRSTQPLID